MSWADRSDEQMEECLMCLASWSQRGNERNRCLVSWVRAQYEKKLGQCIASARSQQNSNEKDFASAVGLY